MSSFVSRAIVQTAILLILVAITFIAAGTIHYWQGWLFWLSFFVSTSATGIYLLKNDRALLARRMRVGPHVEPRPLQRIIVASLFAVFIVILIVPGLDYRFGWSQVPAAIVVAADIVIIGTFGFFIAVLRANTYAASTIAIEAGQRVISSGPYAIVRHPMYSGAVVLIFAIPLALGSSWGLIAAALAIPILVARILDEERMLSAELPGYDGYCRAVRFRLVPLIW
jgi:protein-S-isoprenylcysteine O-methyltransferase Ste14